MNKYNICFLIAGLLPALWATGQLNILGKFSVAKALLIALVIMTPNLLWQTYHHFPVVWHMQELIKNQLNNMDRKNFIFSQFIFFSGSLFLIAAAFMGMIVFGPFKKFRFVGWSYVFVILFFILLKGKNYYSLGLYPVLIALGCVYLDQRFTRRWEKYILPFFAVTNLAVFIVIYPIVFPVLTPEKNLSANVDFKFLGLLKWEDGKDHPLPQDFADMLGWKELARKTLAVYASVADSEKKNTLVICDNYGEAGAINFYNYKKMPPAVSMNADYINWFVPMDIKNIIAVKYPGKTIESKYTRLFHYMEIKDSVENKNAREFGASIIYIRGLDPYFKVILDGAIDRQRF
ncbi:MAG: hypothetical protein NVS9B7_20830 [Flavisolibacter sp.]